jgi:hypothetical protein
MWYGLFDQKSDIWGVKRMTDNENILLEKLENENMESLTKG